MRTGEKKKLMLFDTILDGHHSDYINHIIDYWLENQLQHELYVVTPEGFCVESKATGNVHYVVINKNEIEKTTIGNIVSRGFAVWDLFLKYTEKVHPDHAFLMYLDLYQVGLGFGKKAQCPVSGIFFRPSFHYEHSVSLKEKVVGFRKKWMLKKMLENPSLEYLFSLDHSSVLPIQGRANHVQVVPVSDPVKRYVVSENELLELREKLKIEAGRKVFLLFGYLDDRKGIEQVLDAIALLSDSEASKVALLLVGPIGVDYQYLIEKKIEEKKGEVQVITHFTEIKGGLIQTYFELADFVLTLYQKHIGMSSIVVRAALSAKPLISSDFGYMGKLVEQNGFGETIDSSNPAEICKALTKALNDQLVVSEEKMIKFGLENSPNAFAEQIIGSLFKMSFLAESN